MIALAQLQTFAPSADAAVWAPALNTAIAAHGVGTPRRTAHFMAQLFHESEGFTVFVENLNYSAEALAEMWPTRFVPPVNAAYARDPERIANRAYADRMGNGDEASGDGWRYRGRGPIQITGRTGYLGAIHALGVDLLKEPDLLLKPAWGAQAAADFWERRGCNALADRNDIEAITRAINGGLTGLAERQQAYAAAAAIWAA